jgi:hypothetical protein
MRVPEVSSLVLSRIIREETSRLRAADVHKREVSSRLCTSFVGEAFPKGFAPLRIERTKQGVGSGIIFSTLYPH